tara:strand:+ start:2008 stop:3072 length:1065 start_codon:yes stop_codon:yes gene_type:complete
MGKYTTVDDPSAHFQTLLYTGSGSPQDVTNDGNSDLQPDLVWTKARTTTNGNPNISDSSRGVSANNGKWLATSTTDAEYDDANGIRAFNTDGFKTGDGWFNGASGSTYVAWQWKAAGGTTASNSNGSITSTVQANTDAGFSIVQYTGTGTAATIGHGLGVAPAMYIIKNRDQTGTNWTVFHKNLTSNAYSLYLNSTAVQSNSVGYWNGTSPTSTVFSIKNTSGDVNTNTEDYVAYCFAEKQGFSKAGKYSGNENANGPYIHLGFKPAFIMIKNATVISNWRLFDNKRIGYNVANYKLLPNSSAQETTDVQIDMLSNGFKIKTSDSEINSGVTHIYIAFAENPFVTSTGIPTTAR